MLLGCVVVWQETKHCAAFEVPYSQRPSFRACDDVAAVMIFGTSVICGVGIHEFGQTFHLQKCSC